MSDKENMRVDNLLDLDDIGQRDGYIFNAELGHSNTRHLKTTSDGRIILIPQPSDDPNDPLNWSQTKKNIILLVISCTGAYLDLELVLSHLLQSVHETNFRLAAFLPDYGSATGAVTLLPQSAYVVIYHHPPCKISFPNAF